MSRPRRACTGRHGFSNFVQSLTPADVCLCLLSGGGSALLPLPVDGITLGDKQAVTRFLSAAGANIQELNTVRKHLSRVKGGGLARACRAGRLITLIISDVLGDPLGRHRVRAHRGRSFDAGRCVGGAGAIWRAGRGSSRLRYSSRWRGPIRRNRTRRARFRIT